MTDDITRYDAVEGYCGRLSYRPGDEVTVHVACATDTFDVEVHRWGAVREPVWQAAGLSGVDHPVPADADSHGCRWPAAVAFRVPDDWRSGFYHVTLTAHGAAPDRAVGHAFFVVRAGARRAPLLLVLATNTYNAYNTWGGRSLYTGGRQVSFRRPLGRGLITRTHEERDDRKARPVRWGEQPDVDGEIYQRWRFANGYPGFAGSTGWFTYERRFVEWAEANGYELDYAVSSDLADEPEVAEGYALVLGVGHDEYWSAAQRDAVEAYVRAGGNYASFSGNTMFWQVRPVDGGDHMVCHKYAAHRDDPVMGTPEQRSMSGMWSDPVVGRPETGFLGAGSVWGLYHRFGQATARAAGAFTVYRDSHWLFDDTGLRYGDLLGARDGVVGYETVGCRLNFDEYQLPVAAGGDGTPPDIEVVAFSPSSNLAMGEYPASIAALDDQGDLEFVAERMFGRVDDDTLARCRHGNAVMVVCRPFGSAPGEHHGERPSETRGEVVTIGTTDWVFGLVTDPAVAQVTDNVLRRYATS
jgi:hypothetical protein